MSFHRRGFFFALWLLALAALACNAPIQPWAPTATSLAVTETPAPATLAPTASPVPSASATPSPQSAASPAQDDGLSAEVRRQMAEIETQVVTLRGLQPLRLVDRALLDSQELRQRVIDDFLAEYPPEEAADDVRVLSMLGLLGRDFNLHALYVDLLSEQVAGYYDDESETMYVVRGAGFGGTERFTYAHEYVHALQDHIYIFDEGLRYNEEACDGDSERCLAMQALIEGDATLLQEQWLRTYATQQDIADIIEFGSTFQSPVLDSAPAFLQQDFTFPYTYGRDFVEWLYRRGGWAAVDAAFNAPPLSTEHILHPERYPDDRPLRLQLPNLGLVLGSTWREIERDTLGEWYTRLFLEVHLRQNNAFEAAAGWGGDRYVALVDDATDERMLLMLYTWDTVGDAQEFFVALRDYSEARFGERQESDAARAVWEGDFGYVLLERASTQTLWLLAPDASLGQVVREQLQLPLPLQESGG